MFNQCLARIIYSLSYARQLLRSLPASSDPHSAGGRDCDCYYLAFLADRGAETDAGQDGGLRVRNDSRGRLPRALRGEILPGGYAVHSVRCRGCVSLSLGGNFERPQTLRFVGDAGLHRNRSGRLLLCLEEGRAGLGSVCCTGKEIAKCLYPPASPILSN